MPSRRHFALLYSPWGVTFAAFWLFPLLFAFYLSFTHYSPLAADLAWRGGANYVKLAADGDFWRSVRNTVFFVVGTVPLTTALSLALALLLNRRLAGRGFFRAAFFFPSITALVVVALVWSALYAREGIFIGVLESVGLAGPANGFLFSPSTALPAIMLMDVWAAVGYYMLLFLAGLQALPREYFESARLMAATRWQTFRYVVWPALRPITLVVLLLNTIKSFQVFVEVYVMTKGGPLGSTSTMVYFVYDEGLVKFDMGYASSAAYALFVVIALVALVQARYFGFGREVAV